MMSRTMWSIIIREKNFWSCKIYDNHHVQIKRESSKLFQSRFSYLSHMILVFMLLFLPFRFTSFAWQWISCFRDIFGRTHPTIPIIFYSSIASAPSTMWVAFESLFEPPRDANISEFLIVWHDAHNWDDEHPEYIALGMKHEEFVPCYWRKIK